MPNAYLLSLSWVMLHTFCGDGEADVGRASASFGGLLGEHSAPNGVETEITGIG